ncbi:Hypothetical protein FKW44_024419, partial [Caligus rogercresseyi]
MQNSYKFGITWSLSMEHDKNKTRECDSWTKAGPAGWAGQACPPMTWTRFFYDVPT